MILDSKHISYEAVDVAQDEEAKLSMRRIVNDSKALPPQICKGDIYCGVSQRETLTPCPTRCVCLSGLSSATPTSLRRCATLNCL